MSIKGEQNISNAEYHGERLHLSSSNLKTLLKSPKEFYEDKILGTKVREEKGVFDEGSLVHAMILEPDVVDAEFAFYDGQIKRGKEFEAFKATTGKKIIISKPQLERAALCVNAYYKRQEAQRLLKGGKPELSIFDSLSDVDIKVRFDYINVEKGYIADIKTTGYSGDLVSFRQTIKDFRYDLSAALYLQIAEKYYGRKFDFYFVVLSKPDQVCEVYKLSNSLRSAGDRDIVKALELFKECKATGVWSDPPAENSPVTDSATTASYEIKEI